MSKGTKTGWLLLGAAGILVAGAVAVLSGAVTARDKEAGKPAAAQASEKAGGAHAAKRAAVAVTVRPATQRAIQRTVEVVGNFEGLDEVDVVPKVQGRVVKIFHDLGDVVRPGEPLLEIERIDFELAVDEGRRGLQSELAKLGLEELPKGPLDIEQLPSVVRARNLAENAQRKVKRAEQLRKSDAVSQEDLEQVMTDSNVALANLRQAVLDAQSTLATARYKASILATAQQRLDDTRVLVPLPTAATSADPEKVEYVVAERLVSEGEFVRGAAFMGTVAFRLVIDKELKLMAAVPERHVGQVRAGQTVHARVDAWPERVFEGRIVRVSPTVDRVSRTFHVEVRVPNPERWLKAGGFAKVDILTEVDAHAVTVPVEAIVSFAGTTKVFAVKDAVVHAVRVVPGISGREGQTQNVWVEVRGEVKPGDLLVVSGQEQLVDGGAVRIRDEKGKTPSGPEAEKGGQEERGPGE